MQISGEGGSRDYSLSEQRHPPGLPLPEGPAPGEEREPNHAETRVIHSAFDIAEDDYGSQSRQAVANLQLANNIPVDSIVSIGVKTWHLITQVYEQAMSKRQESTGESRAEAVEQSSQIERETAEVRHHRNKERWLYEQEPETSTSQSRQPTTAVPPEMGEQKTGRVWRQDVLNRAQGKSNGEDLRELPKDETGRAIIPQPEQGDHVVTVLIHGINASSGTFQKLGEKLGHGGCTRVIQISPDDNAVTLAEKVKDLRGETVIRVEFTNNSDDMDRGSEQIKELLVAVANSRDGHAVFNLVGHSAGGVEATRAVQLMGPEPPAKVQALITVDSPLSGSDATNPFEVINRFHRVTGEMSEDLLRYSAFIERVQSSMDQIPPGVFKVCVASREDEVVDMRSQTGLPGAYVHISDNLGHADLSYHNLSFNRYEPVAQAQETIDFVTRVLHNQSTAADYQGISNGDAGYHDINPNSLYYASMTIADLTRLATRDTRLALELGKDLIVDSGLMGLHALENEATSIWKTGSAIVKGFGDAGTDFYNGGQRIYQAASNGQWGKALFELGATPARAGWDLVEGVGKGAWEFTSGQVNTVVGLYQDGRQLARDLWDDGVEAARDIGQTALNTVIDAGATIKNAAQEVGSSAVSGVKRLFGW